MKRLSDNVAIFLEKYEPFEQSVILSLFAGVGSVILLTAILMIL